MRTPGKNETTLVDENNVLGDFTFSYPGVDFSVDENQLHVSTSETDFGTITAEKSLPSSIPGVVTGGRNTGCGIPIKMSSPLMWRARPSR